ncbi:MAG: pyridoxal-dependent decarboxylase, exosortase A system-associated [Blastomonas sp.]
MSKPLGPIPAGFAALDGELAVDGIKASDLVERAGDTPCFIYSEKMLRDRMARLRAAMPDGLGLHFAMKANPYPPVLAVMAEIADGLDVASGGELALAIGAGMSADHISFAGPGKRDDELRQAITTGATLNLESEGEAERALAIADSLNVRARLAVRVNPDFDLRGSGMRMGGGAKQFGIDQDRVPDLVRHLVARGADWRGFHIFAGSQALDADAVIETQANTIRLAAQLSDAAGSPPPHVNLGGGFGIPYFPGDTPIDIDAIGAALGKALASLPPILQHSRFAIELGRWLTGEAGVYLTRIVDRKVSHGDTFLITDGGLHHQLAASGNFGTVVRRNYPVAIASRFDAVADDVVNVVGCLCTPLDRLADKAELPRADVGDLVAVFCAGAYGASASPSDFLGHGKARELLV